MQKKLSALLGKIGKLILAEVLEPLQEIKDGIDALDKRVGKVEQRVEGIEKRVEGIEQRVVGIEQRIEKLHEVDPAILECDLASLDNQICTRIAKCRERQYTTAEDRRIVSRMHEAYRARGGNHGEENEYAIFCRLPTEEAYWQSIGGNA